MKRILVVANETVAGRALIDAVKRHADGDEVHVHVICPQNQPKHGYVIYEDHVRDATQNRLEMTLALLREEGIEADGRASGRPVEHVVVDLDADRDDVKRTLVVANQTVGRKELIEHLKHKAEDGPRGFIVICPQSGDDDGANGDSGSDAHERLAHTLSELQDAGLEAVGQVAHSDPYTAVQNALQFYAPDDIVISTFPETRSGWLRSDLVGRVKEATGKPVEHVVSGEGGEA
jgi:hypothetical protein